MLALNLAARSCSREHELRSLAAILPCAEPQPPGRAALRGAADTNGVHTKGSLSGMDLRRRARRVCIHDGSMSIVIALQRNYIRFAVYRTSVLRTVRVP